jgi:hypothetical protein
VGRRIFLEEGLKPVFWGPVCECVRECVCGVVEERRGEMGGGEGIDREVSPLPSIEYG